MEMGQLFTWQILLTIGGASAFTGLITQALKEYFNIPTQILAYIIATITLLLATIFTTGFNISALVLCLFNGWIISSTISNLISTVDRIK